MKAPKAFALCLAAAVGLAGMPAITAAGETLVDSGIDYTESTETINNPGAGYTSTLWMSAAPGDTPIFNPTGSLMLILVDLGGFASGSNGTTDDQGNYIPGKDYDLDDTFFRNLRVTLDNCRKNGCIIALRFRYDDVGMLDPEPSTFAQIEAHIQQIKDSGIFEEYKDILAFVESGFVGSWGEHWGGKFCSFEQKARVLDLLLDAVPAPIPVTVRTPPTFTTWAGITEDDLAAYTPEPDSDASRVCLYNDGYMGSDIDLGTYHNRERDTGWVGRQALTSYFGGEFSGNLEFTMQYETYLPQNSIPEMYKTHLSYINSNIYQLYKDYTFGAQYDVDNVDNSAYYGQTVYKFMRDHIGYRFVVRDCDLSAQVEQGDVLTVRAEIENTGFANPIMTQKPEILLEKDGNFIRTQVDVNTKTWYSRTTAEPEFQLRIPGGLETGEWNVYFKLSTGDNTLDQMHMRSVKFANTGTWHSGLGANYLGTFTVTETDDTAARADDSFRQINAEQELPASDGEMYTINGTAAADGAVSNAAERAEAIRYAQEGENALYLTNDDKYLYVMAELDYKADAPVFNLSFDNKDNGKNYWLYYQGNGFIYYNQGMPYGVVQRNSGSTIEFRLPLGELMGLERGVTMQNIRVTIQDEANSWVKAASITAPEYTVQGNFNIYSAKRTVYLAETESLTLNARTTCDKPAYQWYLDGELLKGETGETLTITGAKNGLYSVEITDSAGTVKTAEICQVLAGAAVLRGDVDLNGEVNVADIVLLQRYLLAQKSLSGAQLAMAQLHEDGNVNGFDLAVLKRMVLA